MLLNSLFDLRKLVIFCIADLAVRMCAISNIIFPDTYTSLIPIRINIGNQTEKDRFYSIKERINSMQLL
jgi:hypothetical protein